MMPSVLPRWLYRILFLSVLITALVYLHAISGLRLVLIATLWPLGPVFGMHNGIRRASPEAWQKRPSKFVVIMFYSLLFSIILFPAIVALFIGRLDVAMALTVAIVFSMALILAILPHPSPPSTKLEGVDRMS